MSSPSTSTMLIVSNSQTKLLVKRAELNTDKKWALRPFNPGRTLDQMYTVLGHTLEKKANRLAHRMGKGPHVAAQKLEARFGEGEQRLRQLELLRTSTPPKVQDYCSKLLKYTFPTEAPDTQFLGLRVVFLGFQCMGGATSVAGICELWDLPSGREAPTEEWSFWQGLAADCLSDTSISERIEVTPLLQLPRCQEGSFSIIEELLVVWNCSTDSESKFSAALCVRYLGGILELPGFWSEMNSVHSLVAKKLCRELVRASTDIGVDVLELGSLEDPEPPFDYDGLDLLAVTVLVALSTWFGKLDAREQVLQPWYESLCELLRLLRASQSADLLPQATACAIDVWGPLASTQYQNGKLDVITK
ncbi:hypothetical protein C8F04DRAFT_739166 [Mycena alexandri]|uniref:Uncharacterized protein n=1 Tax=Mycena alexandri TaxID=1745969 RepID=A0AAD6SNE0_9AGAR|nr:hypothetical protein C8F04DRAFT_739166 [Mycena alexandri]